MTTFKTTVQKDGARALVSVRYDKAFGPRTRAVPKALDTVPDLSLPERVARPIANWTGLFISMKKKSHKTVVTATPRRRAADAYSVVFSHEFKSNISIRTV